jgi:hypothetical protein
MNISSPALAAAEMPGVRSRSARVTGTLRRVTTPFRMALAAGTRSRRHHLETADGALPVRTVPGLAQGQEPAQPGHAAGARGTMVTD